MIFREQKKIKIAHIQLMPMLSGVQRVSVQEIELLSPEKYEVSIICKGHGPLVDILKDKAKSYFVPTLCREISPLRDLKSLFSLYRLFKKEKYDIVHTHSSKTGVLGRIAAKLAGVPCIVHTIHGFAFESTKRQSVRMLYRILERIGAKCSSKIICLHNDDKIICEKLLKIEPRKIEIISNGVDIRKFSPAINKGNYKNNILGVGADSLVFTMVGRLWAQKNPLFFAEAASKIISSDLIPNAKFIIVGDGELKKELREKYLSDKVYADRIIHLGWREDIAEILKASDVFVLPSLWEGMPLAILEAQATGLPCIVSNISGNRSLVTDSVDGYLIELDDVNTLIDAICKINNKEIHENMSINCRKKIVEGFDIIKRIKRIEALYADGVQLNN